LGFGEKRKKHTLILKNDITEPKGYKAKLLLITMVSESLKLTCNLLKEQFYKNTSLIFAQNLRTN